MRAAREGFLGESLSKLRLTGVGSGEEEKRLCWVGGGACAKACGWVGRVQLRSMDTCSWAVVSSVWRGNSGSERGGRYSGGPQCQEHMRAHSLLHAPQSHSAPCWEHPHLLPGSPPGSLGSSHSSLLAPWPTLVQPQDLCTGSSRLRQMPFSCAWRTPAFVAQASAFVNAQESTVAAPDGGGCPATPGTVPTAFLGSIFHRLVQGFLDESCLCYY